MVRLDFSIERDGGLMRNSECGIDGPTASDLRKFAVCGCILVISTEVEKSSMNRTINALHSAFVVPLGESGAERRKGLYRKAVFRIKPLLSASGHFPPRGQQ